MPYLLKDLHDGIIIPLSAREMTTNRVVTVLTFVSLCADIAAIYALVKQRNIPLDSRFLISMIAADFFFGFLCINVELINGIMVADSN